LRDAGKFALDIIEKRDAERLGEAGELVNNACSACHDAYWFPNSIQPVQ
jgi:cytochrome c556